MSVCVCVCVLEIWSATVVCCSWRTNMFALCVLLLHRAWSSCCGMGWNASIGIEVATGSGLDCVFEPLVTFWGIFVFYFTIMIFFFFFFFFFFPLWHARTSSTVLFYWPKFVSVDFVQFCWRFCCSKITYTLARALCLSQSFFLSFFFYFLYQKPKNKKTKWVQLYYV